MELGRQAEQQAAVEGGSFNVDFREVAVDSEAGANWRAEASEKRALKALFEARLTPLRKDKRKRVYLSILPAVFVAMSFLIAQSGGDNHTAAAANSYAIF